MSTIKVTNIEHGSTTDGGIQLDNAGHVTVDGQQMPTAGQLSNRNLIINGAMNIAQRGTSTSVAAADGDTFLVDRFFVLIDGAAAATYSQSTEAPADFSNSIKLDVTTADTSLNTNDQLKLEHRVEGYNSAFLNWGTSDAKTVTLSFWIRSNLTGNTQVAFVNNGNNRNYVATFTIDSANTWEQKTLTVPGDTAGTWETGNGIGIRLRWGSFGPTYQTSSVDQWVANSTQLNSRSDSPINFASSTDNELYITGVQLEVGAKSTSFEHRSYGDDLARCQRYYEQSNPTLSGSDGKQSFVASTGSDYLQAPTFKVTKRASPTMAGHDGISEMDGSGTSLTFGSFQHIGVNGALRLSLGGSGRTDAQVYRYHWSADAEL